MTEQEIQILYGWVKKNDNFNIKVMELPEDDTLRQIANNLFNTIESDDYEFAAADEKKVKKLNTNYRIVYPLAIASPALGVEFFSAQSYTPGQLKELLAIKEQIVSLNLNRMPVKDEELKTISQFNNLRKLNLSFTVSLTDAWKENYEPGTWIDCRNEFSSLPKLEAKVTPVYSQVFEERTGFVPNLSILDLLFCEGKNASVILAS